jgi:hypothetical protein
MFGALSSLPHTPSWRGVKAQRQQNYFTFTFTCVDNPVGGTEIRINDFIATALP